MDWSVALSGAVGGIVGGFIGMCLARFVFGRPIVVNITMPKPLVTINAADNYRVWEQQ